jgi:G6PDH family F420-dependent oxidoreductase
MQIGYFLSSEEHAPSDLVRQAQLAEQAGMDHLWISDHFHPWLDEQGHSPFVWSVIGAIAATTSVSLGTAVTCPTVRIHPAIIAQAAATSAMLLDGRFELGVGTGEALNEHILGDRWPPADIRLEMLEEAVEVIRALWRGEVVDHHGTHYTVENARLYSLPDTVPPVMVSAFGPKAAEMAGRIADGLVTTSADKDTVEKYRAAGGKGPIMGSLKLCWGEDEDACVQEAHRLWRSSGVPGQLNQELPMPAHFDQAATLVTLEQTAESTPCGPDVGKIVEQVEEYAAAGYDRLYLNQIGPRQEEFFRFYRDELGPRLNG